MSARILVVEDEPDILDVVTYNLRQSGFVALKAADGETALAQVEECRPDLIILDLMLPGIDGLEVCRRLKQNESTRNVPVLMLTARTEEIDRIVGLELGADDYVVKPFSPRELVLRTRAILRRSRGAETASPDGSVEAGPIRLDIAAGDVSLRGEPLQLTAIEFKLLATLVERRGRVQSRDELLRAVWDYEYEGYARTVDTHVRRLREKLGNAADMVETVRGMGYRFRRTD